MASSLFANLIAAVGPPITAPTSVPLNSEQVPVSTFASLLASLSTPQNTAPASPSAIPTSSEPALPGTIPEGAEDPLLSDATQLGASFAGLVLPLPAALIGISLPVEATGALPEKATLPVTGNSPIKVPPEPPDVSRTEQLRFTLPATPILGKPAIAPTTPSLPADSEREQGTTLTSISTTEAPQPMLRVVGTADTPADVVRVAALVPAVVAQVPVLSDRNQTLPVAPVEIGTGTMKPPVPELTPVAGLPPVSTDSRPNQQTPLVTNGKEAPRTDTVEPPDTNLFARTLNTVPTNPAEPRALPATISTIPVNTPSDTAFATPTPTTVSAPTPPAEVPAEIPIAAPNPTRPAPISDSPVSPMLQPIEEWPLHQTVPKHANWELPAIEPDSPQKKETVVPAAIVSSEGGLSSRPVRHSAPETVTTPTLVTQFPEVMATHARMISHHGGPHEFQLRLDPPDLGEVNVRLIAAGDRIQAEVLVGNDAVRRMIESQLPDLRQRLEAAGLQLSNCDVNTQSDHGRSERSLWEQIAQEVIPSRVRPAPTPKWRENSIPRSGLLDVTA